MNQDLTRGPITRGLLRFAWPFMVGNLLQQLYNVVDTLIVGRYLGSDALGAVGSSYTLMTFLTSILLGLSMGSGVFFSICCGQRQQERLRRGMVLSFGLIAAVTAVLNAAVFFAASANFDAAAGTGVAAGLDGDVPLCHFLRNRRHVPL